MIKKSATLFLLALAAAFLHAQSPAPAPAVPTQIVQTHRVIFVVTSGDSADWQESIVLADHYLAGIKPQTAEVEVLAYSAGIRMLAKGATTAGQFAAVTAKGVHFVACQNAMRTRDLKPSDLLPGVTMVPSGVVELVQKQEAGWSYVKVGH